DIENRLHYQEQLHLDFEEKVNSLQKQLNQQAEKSADTKDRSRGNNLCIRGFSETIDNVELSIYFQSVVKAVKPNDTNFDLSLDCIHRLPKPNSAPAATLKDVIVQFHYYHVKEEFLGAT
ncbi:Hypothetical predicted protein, partial [Pelobates cultripes]